MDASVDRDVVSDPILECREVSKSYGGVHALDQVTFYVAEGEVFGVVGPNGAGKTTLFDVICGQTRITRGSVTYRGREITSLRAHAIARAGLQRTFQTPLSFPDLTVRENLLVGAHFGSAAPLPERDHHQGRWLDELVDFCGLADVASTPAGPLSVILRKKLMIATALAANPTLLLLDEPMGGLNHAERESMVELLRSLNERGVTLLVIEHVLSALLQIVTKVLILDHGKAIFEGTPQEMVLNPEVVRVYLGQEAERLSSAGVIGKGQGVEA